MSNLLKRGLRPTIKQGQFQKGFGDPTSSLFYGISPLPDFKRLKKTFFMQNHAVEAWTKWPLMLLHSVL